MNKDTLRKQLMSHEGIRLRSYMCPAGHLTIGIGRNVEANPVAQELGRDIDKVGEEITYEEAIRLLDHDMDKFADEVGSHIKNFNELSESRQHVLIDMAFNMGTQGLLKFKKMLAAIREDDFAKAADEMVNSKWAKDVKERRSKRLFLMMKDSLSFEEAAKQVP